MTSAPGVLIPELSELALRPDPPVALLGRDQEALTEGHQLLAEARDRLKPLLVLAPAYQRQYR